MKKIILSSFVVLALFSCQDEERENDNVLTPAKSLKIKKMNFTLEDGSVFTVLIDLESRKSIENEGFKKFIEFTKQNSNYALCYESENSVKIFKNQENLTNYIDSKNEKENSILNTGGNNPTNLICSGWVTLYDTPFAGVIANYTTSTNSQSYYLNNVSGPATSALILNNCTIKLYGPMYQAFPNWGPNGQYSGASLNYITYSSLEKTSNIASIVVYDFKTGQWISYSDKIYKIDIDPQHCFIKA